ncbi:MAG: cell division protein FtsL [Clostridiales bacterium]|nr:cell division protein FtsL [Clostridiales bacterium]
MDAKKRRQYYNYYGTSYIDGNTVRKYDNAPDIQRERRPHEIPAPRRQRQRNPRALQGLSLGSLLMLSIAIVATLYICVEYLKLHSTVNHMEKTIISMEQTLADMIEVNEASYDQINMVYDLDYVYRVAVEEYGMVYPNKNEVITYKSSNDNYVRQYRDIPE